MKVQVSSIADFRIGDKLRIRPYNFGNKCVRIEILDTNSSFSPRLTLSKVHQRWIDVDPENRIREPKIYPSFKVLCVESHRLGTGFEVGHTYEFAHVLVERILKESGGSVTVRRSSKDEYYWGDHYELEI